MPYCLKEIKQNYISEENFTVSMQSTSVWEAIGDNRSHRVDERTDSR